MSYGDELRASESAHRALNEIRSLRPDGPTDPPDEPPVEPLARPGLTRWNDNPRAVSPAEHDRHCDRTSGGWIIVLDEDAVAPCPICALERSDDILRQRVEESGIPARYLDTTWSDLDLEHDPFPRLRASSERVLEILAAGSSAILHGPPGTGKTQAAALLARAALMSGRTARLENLGHLALSVRETFNDRGGISEADAVRLLATPDLLVLDDLGAGETTKGTIEKRVLYLGLEARQNHRRSTIVTTNLEPEELVQSIGRRIINRLSPFEAIAFVGRNFRRDEAARAGAKW